MDSSIVRNVLTDGSETFDVVFLDGSEKVTIAAGSERGALAIQEALALWAEYATIEVATLVEVTADPDEYPPACSNPAGHDWAYTGTQYGGDDERWHGEGRAYCRHCGADGDA